LGLKYPGSEPALSTGDHKRSVVEDAPKETLIDLKAFHLYEVELYRTAAKNAEFRDDALVRKRKLGSPVAQIRSEPEEQPDTRDGKESGNKDAALKAVLLSRHVDATQQIHMRTNTHYVMD